MSNTSSPETSHEQWYTYTNKKYGFSVSLPPSWTATETDPTTTGFDVRFDSGSGLDEEAEGVYVTAADGETLNQAFDKRLQSADPREITNITTISIGGEPAKEALVQEFASTYVILVLHNNRLFEIDGLKLVQSDIIDTFRFLSPST